MELFTAAEMAELWLTLQSEINAQFEYWLTVSFAVVVAGFVAGSRLRQSLRYVISFLYLLAVITFASRWYYAASEANFYQSKLSELGLSIDIPWVTLISRASLMLLGSVAVIVFLIKEQLYSEREHATKQHKI